MRSVESFDRIWKRAAKRKGGDAELEALLPEVKSSRSLQRIDDSRWLASATKYVFSAGFVWAVVENKWDGFEKVFGGFDVLKIAKKSDKALGKMATDERIIRNRQKVWAVRDNARFMVDVAAEHGSFARFIARWPDDDVVGLYAMLKQRGSRLGGASGGWFLRAMGKDVYMFTPDVIKALVHASVVSKKPTSKKDLAAAQSAFDTWRDESGRGNAAISRVLSCSVP